MPQINVHTPFLLSLKTGVRHAFAVGTHEVTPEVASHWYTLEHAHVVEEEKQEAGPEATGETVKPKAKRKGKGKTAEVSE
jgi:hypothetical protein